MPLGQEILPETALLDSILAQSQHQVVVAEMNHYIRLSKTSPATFERLRLLVDFLHTATRDN